MDAVRQDEIDFYSYPDLEDFFPYPKRGGVMDTKWWKHKTLMYEQYLRKLRRRQKEKKRSALY